MDGVYQDKKAQFEIFLTNWVACSIKNKSWEQFHDLHLDEINEVFRQRKNWIEGSFFVYEIILNIIKTDKYDCLLVIPLAYSNKNTRFEKLTWNNIKSLLDLSPPSFYIFPREAKNYEETIASLVFIEKLSFDSGFKVFYKEEENFAGEFNRSLYILAHLSK